MPFLRCPKCGCIPVYWDLYIDWPENPFSKKKLVCPACGMDLKIVPGDAPNLDENGYPIKSDKEVDKEMPMKLENFEAVISGLADDGYVKQVPEGIVRRKIADVCKIADRRTISVALHSMRDLGLLSKTGFEMYEVVTEAEP